MQNTSYPTDVTDTQWQLPQPLLPPPKPRGRKPADRRCILNALSDILRPGCACRLLPRDFGPWQTLHHHFRLGSADGTWKAVNELLRREVRPAASQRSQPPAAILDSQTVRSADHVGDTGYASAKKTKGRKRHLLVVTLGLLLWVHVSPADVPERQGGRALLAPALRWWRWLRTLFVDGGSSSAEFADWVAAQRNTGTLEAQVVWRTERQRGFAVLPRRWIVERTFGWFMKQRRLVRDYEPRTRHAEAWLYLALVGLMFRWLAGASLCLAGKCKLGP